MSAKCECVARSNQTFLASSRLLRRLPERTLRRLAAVAVQRDVREGERIFAQDDECDSFYCVASGRIRIDAVSPLGREICLNYIGPGDCFGEIAAVDGSLRTAGACAAEASKLLAIDRRDFRRLINEESEFAVCMLRLLCERIRWTTNLYEDSTFLNPPARLAKYVLTLAAHQSLQTDIGAEIRISQSELARFLGVSRKAVNQQLHDWKKRGWVKVARARLIVLDPYALRHLGRISPAN